MNLPIIIVIAAAIVLACLMYFAIKNAQEVDENYRPIPKFEPRKVVDNSIVTEKPKRRYKKRNKKKPTVVNNAPVEKRPVGRPRISN